MNLAASLVYDICTPVGAFSDTASIINANRKLESGAGQREAWESSPVNPASRIDSLVPSHNPKWRIDGCDGQGTRFFAIPIFLLPDLAPLRIDVFIPDQTKHDPQVRHILECDYAFCLRDKRVARLGVSQYILRVLERWTERWTERSANFHAYFHGLPFGSRVLIDKISTSIEESQIQVLPNTGFCDELLSVETLKDMWNIPSKDWPTAFSLHELSFVRQLHDTITIIRIPQLHPSQEFVFKSNTKSIKHMYHEVKMLLTMAPHPHVMPPPLCLVTTRDTESRLDKVCGFVLQYYPRGSLGDVLSAKGSQNSLILQDQVRWALQITRTLIAINNSTARFFSELKPDNLLLSANGNADDIVFIDFEQHNCWHSFSPPEVYYLQFAMRLSKSKKIPENKRVEYARLVHDFIPPTTKGSPLYANPATGYSIIWNTLTTSEQESAEVFLLGKAIWCIYEGAKDTRNSVFTAYRYDSGLEFPDFRKTPLKIRTLIKQCTAGCPSWHVNGINDIIRLGSKIYPRGRTGVMGEPMATAQEAAEAASAKWQGRVHDMKHYLETKKRCRMSVMGEEERQLLGFPMRPRLTDVLAFLEDFKAQHQLL